jgi:hypothetical protein
MTKSDSTARKERTGSSTRVILAGGGVKVRRVDPQGSRYLGRTLDEK